MTTIHVIDDDEAIRLALSLLLQSAGHEPVTFDSSETYLRTVPADPDACLVLDLQMPGLSGLDLMDELAKRGPLLPIIMLTGHGDVPMAVAAMKRGALDFLEKPFEDTALLGLIDRATALLDQRRGERQVHDQHAQVLAQLTPREREIMERVVKGQSNKVIAIELDISERTVEIHRGRVMKKIGVRSVAELVQYTLHQAGEPPRQG
jgi:FixJ family two-component response regulator